MSISEKLFSTTGEYLGTSFLWLSPQEPAQESSASAVTGIAGNGRYFIVRYSWSWENLPQNGLVMLGQGDQPEAIKAVWTDSWHMQNKFMDLNGKVLPACCISLTGSYSAPPGPDWGWQIDLDPTSDTQLTIHMYNIPPAGKPELAVEMILYKR